MDKGFQVEASVCFASLWLYFDGYAITDAHVPHEKLSNLSSSSSSSLFVSIIIYKMQK